MYRPQIEALEDRSLLSVSVVGNVLTITGTQRNDVIALTLNVDLSAQLNINGAVTNIDAATIIDFVSQPNPQININALGGNDSVRLTLAEGLQFNGLNLAVNVNLGNGNDQFMAIANNVDLDLGTNFRLTVNGGRGNDTLIAQANNMNVLNNSTATLIFNGEQGNDVLRADTSGIVQGGSTLNYRANGGDGSDFVIGVHRLNADSNGTVNAAVVGGRGRDNLALWLVREASFDAPTINALLDGGDLASGLMSRDKEDMVATDNVFATNFGPGSRGVRFTIPPII
jgi:Ca2+-binding RTX toxin-like protein